jgi:predicted NUDIX family NTP pyrophosphohydrolase
MRRPMRRPSARTRISAGLLLYRRLGGARSGDAVAAFEVFLAHPGGPFWHDRDLGAWTIPKGAVEEGEAILAAACREFEEETGVAPSAPFVPLGEIRQRAGKRVHAWAWEGDADPATATSNIMRMEHPRGSGRWLAFPEVDRCDWFSPDEARRRLLPAQAAFVDRLEAWLAGGVAAPLVGPPAPDGREQVPPESAA